MWTTPLFFSGPFNRTLDTTSLISTEDSHLTPMIITKRSRSPGRHALTLVEMLISVTLTLLVVFAVVQIFDQLGEAVALGRSTIEMSGQLRTVAARLQDDLDNVTCPVVAPLSAKKAAGFFRYEEGPVSDGTRIIANSGDTYVGDYDDLLTLTVQSSGEPFTGRMWVWNDANTNMSVEDGEVSQIFVQSRTAEVVWWVATLDTNNNSVGDIFEPRMLLRRTLLVRPGPIAINGVLVQPYAPIPPAGNPPTLAFYNNDVSVRQELTSSGWSNVTTNSLQDLSTPGNRSLDYLGASREISTGMPPIPYPHWLASPGGFVGFPSLIRPDDHLAPDDPRTVAVDIGSDPDPQIPDMGEFAQYVVVQDLLSFDVRAFDPQAPIIRMSGNSDLTVSPGDPGFPFWGPGPTSDVTQLLAAIGNTGPDSEPIMPENPYLVGEGAFVDLGYLVNRASYTTPGLSDVGGLFQPAPGAVGWAAAPGATRLSLFSGLPTFRDADGDNVIDPGNESNEAMDETKFWTPANISSLSLPVMAGTILDFNEANGPGIIAYDTWSTIFEHDGISQDDDDNDGVTDLQAQIDDNDAVTGVPDELIDEGTDGLDENGVNGPDDLAEMESPAPYPVPLSGVEVRIRMWDVSTGQVRQVSVVGDFTNK